MAAAQTWARELAAMAPLSLAGHKLLLNGLEFAGSADEADTEAYERARSSADALDGVNAF